MTTFVFKLKDDTGRILHGFLDAENMQQLKRSFRQSNYFFIGANPTSRDSILEKRCDLETLLLFTHRFSSLIEAGIPILSAMNILWRQTEDKTMQLVISHMRKNLEEGNTLSSAMDDFPHIFQLLYRSLIGIAEKAGGLVHVLRKLTEHLEYQKYIKTRVKKAALYPAIVVSFAILVLLGMFTFVVPTFQEILLKLKTDLPLMTRIVLNLSRFVKSWYFVMIIFFLGGGSLFLNKHLKKYKSSAYVLDSMKLKLPYFGRLISLILMSRFLHSLGLLLGAGLSIIESINLSKQTIKNQVIVNVLDEVQKNIEQGDSLYNSFAQQKMFPIIMIEMIGVGESSGSIVKVTETLTTHFDEEVDYSLNKFLTIIEPLMIVVVGGLVIATLLAIYLPIFSIWDSLSGY